MNHNNNQTQMPMLMMPLPTYVQTYRIRRILKKKTFKIAEIYNIIHYISRNDIKKIFNSNLFVLVCKTRNTGFIIDIVYRCYITQKYLDKAFTWACGEGDLQIVKLLKQNGASVCERGMYLACKYGHLSVVKFLIENCYYIPLKYHYYIACMNKNMGVVNYFENFLILN